MNEGSQQPTFSREQKTGFVLLLVFALLTLGMGALQIRNTVYSPFVVHADSPAQPLVSDTIRQQQIDTDHDGINDYEERTLYNTSIYLADSDSDGIGDKEEVQNGTDPLCAEGQTQTCQTGENITNPTVPQFGVPGVQDGNMLGSGALTPVTSTVTPGDLQNIVRDPTALRQLLLSSGQMSQADLEAITDAELLRFAEQLFREQVGTLATSSTMAVSTTQR